MDMASGSVKVEEVTMVTYGDGAAEVNRPWPLSWSAVWTGALAAIAMILIFGLVGVAVGAHRVGHPFGAWHDVSLLALAWSVFGAFISFAVGGWAAAKVAGLRRSETAMLHGSIAWLVAVPILLAMASGRHRLLRHVVRRTGRDARMGNPGRRGGAGPECCARGTQRGPRRGDRAPARARRRGDRRVDGLGGADDVHALPDAAAALRHGGLVTCHSYCSGFSAFR